MMDWHIFATIVAMFVLIVLSAYIGYSAGWENSAEQNYKKAYMQAVKDLEQPRPEQQCDIKERGPWDQ